MKFWLDAQLPPSLAIWLGERFKVDVSALRELGLRDASDVEIFQAARCDGVVIVTKDRDFVELIQRLGVPPQILWLTSGLRQLLERNFSQAIQLLEDGEAVVEVGD